MSSPWIFVVGAPRSGTSLLRRLLSCHPSLHISPELRVLELLLIAGVLSAGGDPAKTTSIPTAALGFGRRYVDALGRHQLAALGRRRIGDKYPPYSLSVDRLGQLFPGAQFVHIIRDGRDVVSSLARTRAANRGWRRSATIPPAEALVRDWVTFVQRAREAGQPLGAARYHELRYEHLLADPAPVMRRLLAFLGESPHPAVLDGAGEIRPGRSWRETLSPAAWQAFHDNPLAEPLLATLGYAPTPTPADRAVPEAPIAARIAAGGDSPALWAAAGEQALSAGDQTAARRHLVRAIRGPHPDRGACVRLLGMPEAPESVFAAMNALSFSSDPQVCAALAAWSEARGLDAAASAALFLPRPALEEVA